mmetsp:Transcript_28840/g.49249  ORF Transcript_28840/g.49249 Transcript_28840/m.49249 type:complete len:82 (+) Transcript_28840:45-290(+)
MDTDSSVQLKAKEKTLNYWISMMSHQVSLKLYDGVSVTGVFEGIDSSSTTVLLSNMQTPSYTYPQAKIRMSDVLSMKFTNQ